MDEAIQTIQALPELGFIPAATPMPGYKFDFGWFEITAVEGFSARPFARAVSFSGVFSTSSSVTEMDFTLPATLESINHVKAFLAYYLDSVLRGGSRPPIDPVWLAEGRAMAHLLPWTRKAKNSTDPLQWREKGTP